MAKILYTEDSVQIGTLVQEILQQVGHKVDHEVTNERAWNAYLSKKPYDLCIFDYSTPPGITGVVLQGRIRAMDKNTPILLYSGTIIELDVLEDPSKTEYLLKDGQQFDPKSKTYLPRIVSKILAKYTGI